MEESTEEGWERNVEIRQWKHSAWY